MPRPPRPHQPGLIRYLSYYLIFPKASGTKDDYWLKQIPFCQDVDSFLRSTTLSPQIKGDILRAAESYWKDHNGVEHRLVIEEIQRPEVGGWGKSPSLHNYSVDKPSDHKKLIIE